jgi:hypothetical protein
MKLIGFGLENGLPMNEEMLAEILGTGSATL